MPEIARAERNGVCEDESAPAIGIRIAEPPRGRKSAGNGSVGCVIIKLHKLIVNIDYARHEVV